MDPVSGPFATRFLGCGVLAVVWLLAACNKEAPTVSAESQAPALKQEAALSVDGLTGSAAAPVERPGTEASGNSVAVSRLSEESFELGLNPKGSYESGKPGEVEIVLSAKAPYKVNDKYPYKFKVKESSGLKFAALVVGKDTVKLEAQRASMPIGFTPENPGKHTVAGQFAFSVCTDEKCLIERRDLALDIEVK